jgi:hypothetical protein
MKIIPETHFPHLSKYIRFHYYHWVDKTFPPGKNNFLSALLLPRKAKLFVPTQVFYLSSPSIMFSDIVITRLLFEESPDSDNDLICENFSLWEHAHVNDIRL